MFGVGTEAENAVSCQRFPAGGSNSRIVCRITGKKAVGNLDFTAVRGVGRKKRFRFLVGFGFRKIENGTDAVVAAFFFGSVHAERTKRIAAFNNGGKGTVTGFYRKARNLC